MTASFPDTPFDNVSPVKFLETLYGAGEDLDRDIVQEIIQPWVKKKEKSIRRRQLWLKGYFFTYSETICTGERVFYKELGQYKTGFWTPSLAVEVLLYELPSKSETGKLFICLHCKKAKLRKKFQRALRAHLRDKLGYNLLFNIGSQPYKILRVDAR